jgi:hypothetical protein
MGNKSTTLPQIGRIFVGLEIYSFLYRNHASQYIAGRTRCQMLPLGNERALFACVPRPREGGVPTTEME